MSPMHRPISGPALSFALDDELRILREQLGTSRRVGRTLVKDGALRVTLVGLSAGGTLRPHKAEGPITLHVLEGAIELEAEGERWTLPAGTLFALGAGITHAVSAPAGGAFLLTVVAPPREAAPDAAT
jgi:quercetin dioxygenase-like cupin family protein